MSLTELLALVERSPESLLLLWVAFQSLSLALGGVGTAVEAVGLRNGWPGVQRWGQRLEGFFSELPKTIRGSRYTAHIEERIDAAARGAGVIRNVMWDEDYRMARKAGMTDEAAAEHADTLSTHPSRSGL